MRDNQANGVEVVIHWWLGSNSALNLRICSVLPNFLLKIALTLTALRDSAKTVIVSTGNNPRTREIFCAKLTSLAALTAITLPAKSESCNVSGEILRAVVLIHDVSQPAPAAGAAIKVLFKKVQVGDVLRRESAPPRAH